MKSKLFLMMSALTAGLMLMVSTQAQSRSAKVVLPCTASATTNQSPQGSQLTVKAKASNNTDAWLPEGTKLYFKVKAKSNMPGPFKGEIVTLVDTTMVLDAMIPVSGSVMLWEKKFPAPLYIEASCEAWYIK